MKGIFAFIGGVVTGAIACGIAIGGALFKSKTFHNVVKDTVKKKIQKLVDRVLWNDNEPSYRTSYGNYYGHYKEAREEQHGDDYKRIIFVSREDAEDVLKEMADIIVKYGAVSIQDMYDAAGCIPAPNYSYKYDIYGWTDLSRAYVIRVKEGRGFGYTIRIPKPTKIR